MLRQINDNGVPLVDGLEVFTSIPILGKDMISFGNSFSKNTITSKIISPDKSDYAIQSALLAGLPVFKNTNWFRYTSKGFVLPDPASDVNKITINSSFNAKENTFSDSGIFQEMNDLIPNNDYTLTINLTSLTSSVGTISISRVYSVISQPHIDSITLNQSIISSYEMTSNISSITLDFKAYSPNDIIFINYSSTVNNNLVDISSISVNSKNQYEIPVVVNLESIGNSKVLALRPDLSVPLDDGEPETQV